MEMKWPTKPKLGALWSFTEDVRWALEWRDPWLLELGGLFKIISVGGRTEAQKGLRPGGSRTAAAIYDDTRLSFRVPGPLPVTRAPPRSRPRVRHALPSCSRPLGKTFLLLLHVPLSEVLHTLPAPVHDSQSFLSAPEQTSSKTRPSKNWYYRPTEPVGVLLVNHLALGLWMRSAVEISK